MTTRRTSCDIHAPGDAMCIVQDAAPPGTYYGRVELRDRPDYGHVSGAWRQPDDDAAADAAQIIGDVLALLGVGIVVAAFVWALLVLLAAMA